MNTSSDKQLNTDKRISTLVLMMTLVLCSPLQGCGKEEDNTQIELEQTKLATAEDTVDSLTELEQTKLVTAEDTVDSLTELEQTKFATADEAVKEFIAALGKGDVDSLLDIFGREYEEELIGGDPIASRESIEQAYEKAKEMHKLRDDGKDRKILYVGSEAWPVPYPLVKEGDSWYFDTEEGIEEVVNRRIGKNELDAIKICRAYMDAQIDYSSVDRDGDKVREYAQKIGSTEGKKDGLYWESGEGQELSPFGPLIADSKDYLEGHEPGDPFKGYHYKIITRQGEYAAGGRYDYIINGNMIAGFAFIAFPADHDNSGIMTFMCSHQNKVYQKNLGEDSDLIAAGIDIYNPDETWSVVEE